MSQAALQSSTPARAPLNEHQRRALAETALERALEAVTAALEVLDALDGDPDLEDQCEDEGGQCDDEGAIEYEGGYEYAGDGIDQTRLAGAFEGVAISPLGVR